MQKTILFYKFTPLTDTTMVLFWQRELATRLGLKGRILISKHGINGILGGNIEELRAYKREMNKSVTFKGIHYKWSEKGTELFPRLSVKVRDEIVSFQAGDEIKVDENGVVGGGKHLKPEQVNKLVKERGDDVIFFDGRNKFEAEIGRFKNAMVPDVANTRDFIKEIEKPKYDNIKDKPVVTYCTGGVRCEILSVLLKNRGFKEVYQIDGGIQKYGEKYGDTGLWEGKMYVFDGRITTGFSDASKDIANCVHCSNRTSRYINCANLLCNRQVLVCEMCANKTTHCELASCKKQRSIAV